MEKRIFFFLDRNKSFFSKKYILFQSERRFFLFSLAKRKRAFNALRKIFNPTECNSAGSFDFDN